MAKAKEQMARYRATGSTKAPAQAANDNGRIIQLPVENSRNDNGAETMIDNENGWTYQGIKEYIDNLEDSLSRARSRNTVSSIARALQGQDEQITREIERLHDGTADVKGSEKALMTYRRRVRTLLRKAKEQG